MPSLQNIKIDFFSTPNGLDPNAISSGVYLVELLKDNSATSLPLYIGESVLISRRCSEHLHSFFEDFRLFGLTKDDFKNDSLTLKFRVLEIIKLKKSIIGAKH